MEAILQGYLRSVHFIWTMLLTILIWEDGRPRQTFTVPDAKVDDTADWSVTVGDLLSVELHLLFKTFGTLRNTGKVFLYKYNRHWLWTVCWDENA